MKKKEKKNVYLKRMINEISNYEITSINNIDELENKKNDREITIILLVYLGSLLLILSLFIGELFI